MSIIEYFWIGGDYECFFVLFQSGFYFIETLFVRCFDKIDAKKSMELHMDTVYADSFVFQFQKTLSFRMLGNIIYVS